MKYSVGMTVTIFLNQGDRTCTIVEVHDQYALGIYVMPAGGAFLVRIMDDGRQSRPTAKEVSRFARARTEAMIDYSYEREDAADTMRSGWKKRLKLKEILEHRASLEAALKMLDEPNPVTS